MNIPVHVAKVGGSLFDLPDLPAVLANWIQQQSSAAWVLMAGGGTAANAVRDMDHRYDLDDAALHWACIDMLNGMARVLAEMLPAAVLITSFDRLQDALRHGKKTMIVLGVADFLQREPSLLPSPPLPHDWRVTSDSIAARLAVVLEAEELVLLKSTSPSPTETIDSAASNGLVDEYFPIAAATTNVRWVNLRNGEAQLLPLLSSRPSRRDGPT
jgi:aspartokinase-like uncharacterized kinase